MDADVSGVFAQVNVFTCERETSATAAAAAAADSERVLYLTNDTVEDGKGGRFRVALCIHREDKFKEGFKIRVPVSTVNN